MLAGQVLIAPFLKVFTRHATWRMHLGFALVLLVLGFSASSPRSREGWASPTPPPGSCRSPATTSRLGAARRRPDPRWVPWTAFAWPTSVVTVTVLAAVQDFGAVGRYAYGFLSPPVVVMPVSTISCCTCCCGGGRLSVVKTFGPTVFT